MSFVDWCDSNHLVLNVTKIKEMVIDFRKQTKVPDLIVIKEKDVERVETFKYLGIVLDNKLTWKQNTDSIVKKKNKTSSTLLEEVANFQCSQYTTPIILWKGLFRCKVFLYRAYIFEQSSLDEMKGFR